MSGISRADKLEKHVKSLLGDEWLVRVTEKRTMPLTVIISIRPAAGKEKEKGVLRQKVTGT